MDIQQKKPDNITRMPATVDQFLANPDWQKSSTETGKVSDVIPGFKSDLDEVYHRLEQEQAKPATRERTAKIIKTKQELTLEDALKTAPSGSIEAKVYRGEFASDQQIRGRISQLTKPNAKGGREYARLVSKWLATKLRENQ